MVIRTGLVAACCAAAVAGDAGAGGVPNMLGVELTRPPISAPRFGMQVAVYDDRLLVMSATGIHEYRYVTGAWRHQRLLDQDIANMSLAGSTLAMWRRTVGTDPGAVEVRIDGPCDWLFIQNIPGHPIGECNWGLGYTLATSDLLGVACDPYLDDCQFFLVDATGALMPPAQPVGAPLITPRSPAQAGPPNPCQNGALLGANLDAAGDLVIIGAQNAGFEQYDCNDGEGWVGVYRRNGLNVELIQEWQGEMPGAHVGWGVATDGQTVLWREDAVGGTALLAGDGCYVTEGGTDTIRAFKRLGPDGPFEEIASLPQVAYRFEIDGRYAVAHDYLIERVGDSWNTVARLRRSNGSAFDEFSSWMSMTEQTVVIGVDRANNNLGAVYVFNLSPPPPPYLTDLDGDGCVTGIDLAILLGSWGPGGGAADLDGDGDVDGLDLAFLLGDWSGEVVEK